MGSGLIYAGIILMWAVYFVPRWLRRHEELSETRSVERFSRAMRILSRKDPVPDQRYVVMPPRPEDDDSHRRRPRLGGLRLPRLHRPHRAPRRPVRASTLAVRRARVLAALLVTTLAVAVATPFTALPWWSVPAMLGVVVLDLAHLRTQARRRAELSRTRRAVRDRTRNRLRRFDSAERIVESRRVIAAERATAEAERRAAAEAADAAARAEAERREAEAAGWSPVPVPLPTYVSKPMAGRSSRPMTIDLTVPGAWIESGLTESGLPTPRAEALVAEEPFDQHAGVPASPALLEEPGDELDAIIERRRAVGD